jgi:salicylate hydroxylase
MRARLGHREEPVFRDRTAWRATVPAAQLSPELREPTVCLKLGSQAHLVHYPVRAGTTINVVAIIRDVWQETGWSASGSRDEIVARFSRWSSDARNLIAAPETWLKWAIFDLPPLPRWGEGPATLLGDAAHPMQPFLAQGAAAGIEDAYVLAQCLRARPDEPSAAFREYESLRGPRTRRLQRASARNGKIYGRWGPAAFARNMVMRAMGGKTLLQRHGWIYDWRPDLPPPSPSD